MRFNLSQPNSGQHRSPKGWCKATHANNRKVIERRFIASIQQVGCWQRLLKILLSPLTTVTIPKDEQKALNVCHVYACPADVSSNSSWFVGRSLAQAILPSQSLVAPTEICAVVTTSSGGQNGAG